MREVLGRFVATTGWEFRSLRREKIALFFMFILPVIAVVIIGLAFGSASDSSPIALFDEDHSGSSAGLIRLLRNDKSVTVYIEDDRGAVRNSVIRQQAAFGIVIPKGYGEDLTSGARSVSITVVSPGGGEDLALVQSSVGTAVRHQAVVETAARVAADTADKPLAEARQAAGAVAGEATLVGVRTESVGGLVQGGGFARAAFTMLVLFVLITALAAAGTFPELRRIHVAQRLLAVPAPTAELELGLVSARFLMIVIQALYIILFSSFVFGVRWGSLAATMVVTLALAVFAAGLSALAGTIFRTDEQASAIGVPIALAVGMLGGAMWPLEIVPKPLQIIGHLTPVAWAIDAYSNIIGDGAGVVDVLPQVGVILAMAVAVFVVGGLRFRRVFAVG